MRTLEEETDTETEEIYKPYEYCFNDPINSSDPSGLAPEPGQAASDSGGSPNFGGQIGTTVTIEGRAYRWVANPADPSRPSLVRIDGQPNPIQVDPATGQGAIPAHVIIVVTEPPPYIGSHQYKKDVDEGFKIGFADAAHGLALAAKFVWDCTLGNPGHSQITQDEVHENNVKLEKRLNEIFTLPSDNRTQEERDANVSLAFLGWNLIAISAPGRKGKTGGAAIAAEARGGKLAEIFTGVPDNAMVHISPATPVQLESGVLVSPKVNRSYWTRWGDVKNLTPTQYRGYVGALAQGGEANANTFVFKLTNATTEGVFTKGPTDRFLGITEYTATQTVKPDPIGVAR